MSLQEQRQTKSETPSRGLWASPGSVEALLVPSKKGLGRDQVLGGIMKKIHMKSWDTQSFTITEHSQ